jgi:hypothetical protein
MSIWQHAPLGAGVYIVLRKNKSSYTKLIFLTPFAPECYTNAAELPSVGARANDVGI